MQIYNHVIGVSCGGANVINEIMVPRSLVRGAEANNWSNMICTVIACQENGWQDKGT